MPSRDVGYRETGARNPGPAGGKNGSRSENTCTAPGGEYKCLYSLLHTPLSHKTAGGYHSFRSFPHSQRRRIMDTHTIPPVGHMVIVGGKHLFCTRGTKTNVSIACCSRHSAKKPLGISTLQVFPSVLTKAGHGIPHNSARQQNICSPC